MVSLGLIGWRQTKNIIHIASTWPHTYCQKSRWKVRIYVDKKINFFEETWHLKGLTTEIFIYNIHLFHVHLDEDFVLSRLETEATDHVLLHYCHPYTSHYLYVQNGYNENPCFFPIKNAKTCIIHGVNSSRERNPAYYFWFFQSKKICEIFSFQTI